MSDLVYYEADNPLNAIDWQRSNASILKAYLYKKYEWLDVNHNQLWESFGEDILDLRTCNDFGLALWSIILVEATYGVTEASGADYPAWGFGQYRKNFENGNFGINSDTGYNFTTEERRWLLQLKAYVIHMSGLVHGSGVLAINEAMQRIFGDGAIYCIDNRDMTFDYVIYDDSIESFVNEANSRGLIPAPVGIEINITVA